MVLNTLGAWLVVGGVGSVGFKSYGMNSNGCVCVCVDITVKNRKVALSRTSLWYGDVWWNIRFLYSVWFAAA